MLAVFALCIGIHIGLMGRNLPDDRGNGGRLVVGRTPGYPGLYQINVRAPGGVAPGPAVLVRLNSVSRPSKAVTLAVQ
jgi:hypothetical protein